MSDTAVDRTAAPRAASLRVRLAGLAALVLALSLGLSLLLSWQLLRVVGERDLDQALAREFGRFEIAVATSIAEQSGAGEAATVQTLEAAVNDYYRLAPPNDTYLTVVRFGGRTVVPPDPPTELDDLVDGVDIPANSVDGFETLGSDVGSLRSLRSPILLDGGQGGSVQVIGRAEPISEATAESLTWLAVLSGISMLLGGFALAFALFRGLRPLQELAATAQRTGELEQLSQRVREPARADEVGVLAQEFNRMLGRLERSARDRTEFLATVSHELRTPVTVARGYAETLERSPVEDPARVRTTAGVIREELTHVGRLIDDMLALNRAQLDDFVIPADVDLERLLADLELRLDGLGLTDVELMPAPDLTVRCDPARLQQALLNLATNATVHTPAGTRVIVSAERDGDRFVLAVADDGPGIDPELVDTVLEPFVKRSSSGGHDSSGLGLAVVAEVARAHGGEVGIDTGPGGTVIRLVLPVAGPA